MKKNIKTKKSEEKLQATTTVTHWLQDSDDIILHPYLIVYFLFSKKHVGAGAQASRGS